MGHLYVDDNDETRECGDEGQQCPECFEKEAAEWAQAFGGASRFQREADKREFYTEHAEELAGGQVK